MTRRAWNGDTIRADCDPRRFRLRRERNNQGPVDARYGRIAETGAPAAKPGKLWLRTREDAAINLHGPSTEAHRQTMMAADLIAAVLSLIPDIGGDLHFRGMGGHANICGGPMLATMGRFHSRIKPMNATGEAAHAGRRRAVAPVPR